MRFGIILNGGSRPELSREQEFTELLLKARTAREAGFHSLWVGPGYLQNGWHPTVLLARVAAEAPGLELGLVGILPLYHPVELAEQLATLDVICGGRVTLAAAIGWRDFQLRAFEVPQEQRLSRFQEVLEVMHKLWSQPRLTHRGEHFQLDDIPGVSAPLQRPYPKLLIAANLDPGIRRAARLADGWSARGPRSLPCSGRWRSIAPRCSGRAEPGMLPPDGKCSWQRAGRLPSPPFAPLWSDSTATGRRWAIIACCQRQTASMCRLNRCWQAGFSSAARRNALPKWLGIVPLVCKSSSCAASG